MTTKQTVKTEALIELTKKSIEAIRQDILGSVFNVEFHSDYPYEEEQKIQAVGKAMLTLEQNQEKLKVVESMLEKYLKLDADEFVLEKE